MLNKLARKGTQIIRNNVNQMEYDEDVYIYGIEIIITTIISIVSILCISAIVSDVVLGMVYMFFFIPLRLYAGGYHALTYKKCFIVSNLSYVMILLLVEMVWENVTKIILWLIVVCVCFYILIKGPIINPAQTISKCKQKSNMKKTNSIICIDIILILFLSVIDKRMMTMAVCSLCSIAMFMVIVEISNLERRNKIWKLL